jgi:transposase
MVSVDSTTCRAHQHAAGARKRPPQIGKRRAPLQHRPDEGLGRSRGGLTCKIHLAGEGGRRPLALLITPGQWGDAPQFIPVIERIRDGCLGGGRPRTRPYHLGGDKGGRPAGFDKTIYRRRNEGERTILALKNSRAVATRFDKRAYVFHGTVTLASIRLWLRS